MPYSAEKYQNQFIDAVAREFGAKGAPAWLKQGVIGRSRRDVDAKRKVFDYLRRRLTSRTGSTPSGSNRNRRAKSSKPMPKRAKTSHVHAIARGTAKKAVKRTAKRRKPTLAKRLARVEKTLPKKAVHDHRSISGGVITHDSGECAYQIAQCFDNSYLETALDNLAFLDRGVTPAIDSIDLTTAAFGELDVRIENLYAKLTFRNNNLIDTIIDAYVLQAKVDTNNTPLTSMTDNDQDYAVSGATLDASTNILTYPTDYRQFNADWQILKHGRQHLRSGDEMHFSYSKKYMKYSPQLNDIVSLTYSRGDTIFFFRAQGSVAYNSATEEQVTTGDGTIHFTRVRKMKVKYDSDAPFKRIETVNSLSSIAAPVQGGPNNAVDQADNHD